MDWTRPVAAGCAFAVGLWGTGALVTLATSGLLSGPDGAAAVVVLAVVAVSVLAVVLLGRRSGRWTANPSTYW